MENKVFKIGLDTEILRKLRNKINEQKNISYNKMYKKYRTWNKIFAIMDMSKYVSILKYIRYYIYR